MQRFVFELLVQEFADAYFDLLEHHVQALAVFDSSDSEYIIFKGLES